MKLAALATACVLAFAPAALAQEVYRPGDGVTSPRLLMEVKPGYTAEAMRAGISGMVRMACVVLLDGTVGDVKVIEALDAGLDEEAVKTLKKWRFEPGQKDGKAVPVLVEVEMTFTLRDGPRLDSPAVAKAGPGVKLPKVTHEEKPVYTAAARSAGIQGSVQLDCVVLANGTVGAIRVTKHLDPDLDAEAIRTLRLWRFEPGEKDGQAVPVQVNVEMTFRLR